MMSAIQPSRRQNGAEEESLCLLRNAEEGTSANNENESRNPRWNRSTILAAMQRRRRNNNDSADLPDRSTIIAAIQRRRQNNHSNNNNNGSVTEEEGLLSSEESTSDEPETTRPRRRLARRKRMALMVVAGIVAVAAAWCFLPRRYFARIMMMLGVRLGMQCVMRSCGGGGRRGRLLRGRGREDDEEMELTPTSRQPEEKPDLELGTTDSGMTATMSYDTSDEEGSPAVDTPAAIGGDSSRIHNTYQVHERSMADPYDKKGTYTGGLSKATQLPHGFGRMDYHGEGHTLYVGDWVQGNWTGKGQLSDADGRYEGELRNGHKHGNGTMRFTDGRVFVGNFVKGQTSKGKMTHPDGSIVEME